MFWNPTPSLDPPQAMLAVGFSPRELEELRALLVELDAHMVELIVATDRMLDMPLSHALKTMEGPSEVRP